MCPAELPAGAENAPASQRAEATFVPSLTPAEAVRIVDLGSPALRRWTEIVRNEVGIEVGERVTLADLVALAALRVTARCLGSGVEAYVIGLARLFAVLRGRADVERLDGFTALVGHDSARIVERYDGESCAADDVLVIPLRPILAELRSQVFA